MSQFFVFHWFTKTGWIGKLFSNAPGEVVNLQPASAKLVGALGQVLVYEGIAEIVAESFSDNVEASTEEVIGFIKNIRDKAAAIESLPDVADNIDDYTFSGDADEDKFIKDLAKTVAVAFSDKKISTFEAGSIIAKVVQYIKLRKG